MIKSETPSIKGDIFTLIDSVVDNRRDALEFIHRFEDSNRLVMSALLGVCPYYILPERITIYRICLYLSKKYHLKAVFSANCTT